MVVSTYEPPFPIRAFNRVPRFNHEIDLTKIYDEEVMTIDKTALIDYVKGTFFVAACCLALFFFWLACLVVMKLIGKRAGIAAGHPFEEATHGATCRQVMTRYLLLFSSLLMGMSGLIFVVKGTQSISNVFDDIFDGIYGLSDIADSVVNITDEFIAFSSNTLGLKEEIVVELEKRICEPDGSGGIADNFDNSAQQVVNVLGALQDFSLSDLVEIRTTFATKFDMVTDDFYDITGVGKKYAEPMYMWIPILIFGLGIFIGTILAWKARIPCSGMFFCLQSWTLLPVFFLIIVIMVIVLAISSIALVVNSDVCMGGESKKPEGFVELVIQKGKFEGDMLNAAYYYVVDSCVGEYERKGFVEMLVSDLGQATESLNVVMTMIQKEPDNIKATCGISQERLDGLAKIVKDSQNSFSYLSELARETVTILECKPINDIFLSFYHDALCTNGPQSLMWIFATLMIVTILGMLTFLNRGAMLPSIRREAITRKQSKQDVHTLIEESKRFETDDDSSVEQKQTRI
ncbi:hypothetical protein CTEN210_15373 [Chaetoceros tenuissimus]|uniref:Uncharacterized protein n=1 Tax=Chaetoceros tenuissimus TaxID=426638 RepID=A0AAD3D7J8_9STRA|nr:hypothetical protein CTEN210_15373 [Chaetoceros tenuissimus]